MLKRPMVYVSETAGTFLQDNIGVRYGSKIDSNLHFRVYGQRTDHRSTNLPTRDAQDQWNFTQGGFRMDYEASGNNSFTVQGDLYGGREDSAVIYFNGQNIVARWNHILQKSGLTVQAYFDRTHRNNTGTTLTEELTTYDLDAEHQFSPGRRHTIVSGLGYRLMYHEAVDTGAPVFFPNNRTLQLINGFVQDQVSIVPGKVELTIGTKLLHNDYTGFEWQPSLRLAITPARRHTIWGAVSRSSKEPSRLDADIASLFSPAASLSVREVIAYELGIVTILI